MSSQAGSLLISTSVDKWLVFTAYFAVVNEIYELETYDGYTKYIWSEVLWFHRNWGKDQAIHINLMNKKEFENEKWKWIEN